MRSTHNTFLAYGKAVVAAIAIVTGTAVMMSTFSTPRVQLKDYSQNKLARNTSPLVNVSNIESINGKLHQQMPDVTRAFDVRVPDPS